MPGPALLTLSQIKKSYVIEGEPVDILRQVDLEVQAHEFLVIHGVDGSGRAALMNIMAGIEPATSGLVHYQRCVQESTVFLSPIFSLDAGKSVHQLLNHEKPPGGLSTARALDIAGLNDAEDLSIQGLDQAARRRVGIARSLLGRPKLILADLSCPPWGVSPQLDVLLRAHWSLGCTVVVTADDSLGIPGSRELELLDGCLVAASYA